jgi:hypothetical protein
MGTRQRLVDLPLGEVAIKVSLINPVNFGPAILKRFMAPPVPGLETFETSPSLAFLLEHPSGRKLVWDLGIRKDFHNYSKPIAEYIPTTNYDIQVTKNVVDILEENGSQVRRLKLSYGGQINCPVPIQSLHHEPSSR